jgi:hypothetical protein
MITPKVNQRSKVNLRSMLKIEETPHEKQANVSEIVYRMEVNLWKYSILFTKKLYDIVN